LKVEDDILQTCFFEISKIPFFRTANTKSCAIHFLKMQANKVNSFLALFSQILKFEFECFQYSQFLKESKYASDQNLLYSKTVTPHVTPQHCVYPVEIFVLGVQRCQNGEYQQSSQFDN